MQKRRGVNPRKIRKGTFSCWECKRRKKRCRFQDSSNAKCVTCYQNGVLCVSQENEEPCRNGSDQNERRLADMEVLVDQLMQQRTLCHLKATTGKPSKRSKYIQAQSPLTLLRVTEDTPSRFGSLCSYLQSVLPCSTTATLIVSHGSSPFAVLERRTDIVECLTAAAKHLSPVTVGLKLARKLIQLALCLERVDNNQSKLADLDFKLQASNHTVARRFVDAASHITFHDSVLSSLEGIELLMLQSSFETCVGNLEKAWLTLRRALNLAQLMDFFSNTGQAWKRARETWLRLVHFDRVLSLMIGQRASSEGDDLTKGLEITNESSSARLERAHTVILGRIISRNLRMQKRIQRGVGIEDSFDDGLETQNIDQEMKKAMRSLPATWWTQPEMPKSEADAAKLLGQIHHFDLLVLVHQPYLISGPHIRQPNVNNGSHEYNKLTAVSASREILTRVLLCGEHRDVPCSLSGLNHKAFTACVSILLAHISGHSLGCENVLEHQRPLDLMMIQKVVDLFKDILPKSGGRSTWDASVLRQLLRVEEEAGNGKTFLVRTGNALRYAGAGENHEEDIELQFSIPYLGQITVASCRKDHAEPPLDSICSEDYILTIQSNYTLDEFAPSWDLDSPVEPGDFLIQTT